MSIYTINESSNNNNNNKISFEMHSALEQFNEHRNTLKMTTGSADLDSLIDGIQEGLFYLFYGNNNYAVQDSLVYRFLVNCVLPIKQKHGFESMGVCFNNVDYYNSRKAPSIDPKIVFKNLYIHTAYNEQQKLLVAEQIANLIESNKDIKLLVVNRLTRFFKESKKKMETANVLKQVVGIVCKACAKGKVALVCIGDSNLTSKGVIPRPIGGISLKHAANVIVHIKEYSNSTAAIPSFKATLVKHQYMKTPKSAVLYL